MLERLKEAIAKHPEVKINTGSMYSKYDGEEYCCALGIIYLDQARKNNPRYIEDEIWNLANEELGSDYVGNFYPAFDQTYFINENNNGVVDGLACREYCIEQGLLCQKI